MFFASCESLWHRPRQTKIAKLAKEKAALKTDLLKNHGERPSALLQMLISHAVMIEQKLQKLHFAVVCCTSLNFSS